MEEVTSIEYFYQKLPVISKRIFPSSCNSSHIYTFVAAGNLLQISTTAAPFTYSISTPSGDSGLGPTRAASKNSFHNSNYELLHTPIPKAIITADSSSN